MHPSAFDAIVSILYTYTAISIPDRNHKHRPSGVQDEGTRAVDGLGSHTDTDCNRTYLPDEIETNAIEKAT